MRVLITGYKGFIGKNLYSYLKNKNYDVDGFDVADIKNSNILNSIPNVSNYDTIVHLGAISSTTERNIQKILNYNYDFSKKILDHCIKNNTSLIYASSASVYGNIQKERNISKIKISDPVSPLSPYGWSKYLFDYFVNNIENQNINVQGLRLFNVYGLGEENKGDQQSVFGKFKKQAIKLKKIEIFENSNQIKRDFIWVGDVCMIIEKMLTITNKKIWNIGTGVAKSFMDIANMYANIYNSKIKNIIMPENLKGQYQYYTCSDNENLKKIIGEHKFKTIEEYINDEKKH